MSNPVSRMNPFRFLPWLASLTLLAGAALAQTPPAPVPAAAAEPAPTSLYGLTASPGGPVDSMKLPGVPLINVLKLLEDLTGRSVIRPQALPTPEISFDSRGPISRQDAVLAIESLLSLNGIAIAPLGEKFIKVVPTASVRTEAPELVVGTLADRPPSGRIVSKLFRLQHLDLNSFQQQIQPFLSPGFGGFVPFQNSSTVLVTDTVSNLQRLEYVIGEVDKPRNIITKFYELKFAQAQQVAEKIRSLIESTRSAFNRQGAQGGGGGAQGAMPQLPNPGSPMSPPTPAGGDGATAALLSSNVSLNFDERTNQIILVSDPTSVEFFDNLIKKLDVQADPSTQIAVIQLQHANATDVVGLMSSFVSSSTTSRSSTATRNTTQQNRNARTQTGLRNTFATPNQNQNRNQQGGNLGNQVPGTGAVPTAGGATGEHDSQFSAGMTITADERSNAIVASGTQDDLNLLRELIKQLDIVLPQVQIDVLIVTATLDDSVQRGIDLFSNITVENNRITKIEGITGPGISLANIVPLGAGKFNGMVKSFQANNSKSKVRVLSVPSITTTHNQQATIIVGDSVPIRTSSLDDSSGTGIATRNNFTYQDVGLQLQVTPLIGSDGTVQMQIDQSADEVTDTDQEGNPLISRRQATSFIAVRDGEIIVLGGLQKKTELKSRSGFPIISEIPLVGRLFGSNTKSQGRDEIMFFIQPRVLLTTDQANRVGQTGVERSALKKEIRVHVDSTNPDVPPTLVEPEPIGPHGPR